jgi:transposase
MAGKPKNIDSAIADVLAGAHPKVAAKRAGVSAATVYRRLKGIENAPRMTPGPKPTGARLETFQKDLRCLLEEEEVDALCSNEELVALITELAAASVNPRWAEATGV